jgi:hypothetical protein
MFTLEYAKDPVYSSADGQGIYLTVKFAEFNEELPFNATSWDCEPHGVDLHNRAKAGEFGEVAPYVPPPEMPQPQATGVQNA